MSSAKNSRAFTDKLSRAVKSPGGTQNTDLQVEPERTNSLGRVLVTVYLILALAATLRAVFQIFTKFDEAPIAYCLSLASGLVYIVATIALTRRSRVGVVVAWAALVFEFVGVLVVGTLSVVMPTWFAHDSVWSYFGMNYFWIPLVLPVLGMMWLRQQAQQTEPEPIRDSRESVY